MVSTPIQQPRVYESGVDINEDIDIVIWWNIDRYINLVGGLEHVLFSHLFGTIIPIDFHIFQRGSHHQPAMEYWLMPAERCHQRLLGVVSIS